MNGEPNDAGHTYLHNNLPFKAQTRRQFTIENSKWSSLGIDGNSKTLAIALYNVLLSLLASSHQHQFNRTFKRRNMMCHSLGECLLWTLSRSESAIEWNFLCGILFKSSMDTLKPFEARPKSCFYSLRNRFSGRYVLDIPKGMKAPWH